MKRTTRRCCSCVFRVLYHTNSSMVCFSYSYFGISDGFVCKIRKLLFFVSYLRKNILLFPLGSLTSAIHPKSATDKRTTEVVPTAVLLMAIWTPTLGILLQKYPSAYEIIVVGCFFRVLIRAAAVRWRLRLQRKLLFGHVYSLNIVFPRGICCSFSHGKVVGSAIRLVHYWARAAI